MIKQIIKTMENDVNKVYQDFIYNAEAIRRESHNAILQELKPGQPAPSYNVLSPAYAEKFDATMNGYIDKAMGCIDIAKEKIEEYVTKAPSEEAMRALSVFEKICPTTKIENGIERERMANMIDSLMNTYDNYLVYEELRSMAEKIGVNDFKDHQVELALKAIDESEYFVKSRFAKIAHDGGDYELIKNEYIDTRTFSEMLS